MLLTRKTSAPAPAQSSTGLLNSLSRGLDGQRKAIPTKDRRLSCAAQVLD